MLAEELKRIKDAKLDIELLKRKNEKECAERNAEIEGLQDIVKSTEANLKEMLTTSGEKKLECKLGYCSFRTMPDKWEYMDSDIIAWCKEDGKPYYETLEVVKYFKLKKDIQNGIFKYEVPGITVIPQEPKFNYKIK